MQIVMYVHMYYKCENKQFGYTEITQTLQINLQLPEYSVK